MMKIPDWRALALLLALVALASCGGKGGESPEADAEAGGDGVSPTSIMAFGSVVAAERQEIHLPWACRVIEIPVWEGMRVSKGDLLAVLDSGDLETAIANARLEAESARGLYEESGSRLAALDVALAEAAERLERTMNLKDSGSVSAQELDSLQAEHDGLVYDRAAAEWAQKALKNESDKADTSYRRLLQRSSGSHVEDNVLVCPFDSAVVAEVHVRPGAEAEAGELAMVLHDEASLLVEADLSEEFVRDVSPGDPVLVVPIADPDRSYAGTVLELAGIARLVNGENTVKTRVRLDERDGFLREGFNVDVEINPVE